MSYITNTQISKMSYNQLGKALTSGQLTEKRLRSAYSELRKTAMQRNRRVSAENVRQQFGNKSETFLTNRNIVTTSQLLHELADVGKFLNAPRSTITGLKEQRQKVINNANALGFDVDVANYLDFIRFMEWFKSSMYSKQYDSNSNATADVFNSTHASRDDWERAFREFNMNYGNS